MPKPSNTCSIVLPAYNEEANIAEAIGRAGKVADRLFTAHEILVVDDGSSDGTVAVVNALGRDDSRIKLISHDGNRGYGEALRTGFRAAECDLVFFTDADNQFDFEELEQFVAWIDRVHCVAGYRLVRRDPFMRRLNAKAWNYLVRVLFYVPVRDIDCAFKLFRREIFDELDLQAVGAMVNTELMVQLGRHGFAVVEIPVTHLPRTAGTPRGANPRVIARAFYELIKLYSKLKDRGRHAARAAHARRRRLTTRTVVIGGGISGLAAARRLDGDVTVLEAADGLGGLARGFEIAGSPIERYYHFLIPGETDVIDLITELGLGHRLRWFEASMGVLAGGRLWPFSTPLDLMKFGPLPLADRIRAGVGALRLGRVRDWEPLDAIPARHWLTGSHEPGGHRRGVEPAPAGEVRARRGPGARSVDVGPPRPAPPRPEGDDRDPRLPRGRLRAALRRDRS